MRSFSHYWMTNVYCNGDESTLYECYHEGWNRHTCRKDEPVYLRCKRSPFIDENRFNKVSLAVRSHTFIYTFIRLPANFQK